jgi:hypothetical protein
MDENKPKHKTKASLAEVFHFTEDDLAVNRTGAISRAQLTRMEQEIRFQVLVWGAVLILILLVFVLLFRLHPPVALVMVLIALGSLAVIVGKPLYKLHQDQQLGRVESVGGYAKLDIESTLSKRYHVEPVEQIYLFVYVGDEKFPMNEKAFSAFNDAAFYTVYFAPLSRRILSVEQISQNPFE